MMRHRKDSLRLQGYDYSESGEYFVTICTSGRRCVLGEIADGKMGLSEIGRIVEGCWHGIPQHFPGTRVRVLQVMPNHVHGIVDLARVGAQHAAPLQAASKKPAPGSLGVIVRSFKSATTKIAHDAGFLPCSPLWQRGYYDRIIRDDTERYFTP